MQDSNANILIIDNDEAVVEALTIRLSAEGFKCFTANCGAQGLSLFHEMEFDAVLTDLNMPSGDGVTVIESIRETSRVPVLVVTGFESAYAENIAKFENVIIIPKPFALESLLDELEIAIGMSELS